MQEILGHSDVRTTEGHTHVASEIARDAAARMGLALWGTDGDTTSTTTSTPRTARETDPALHQH